MGKRKLLSLFKIITKRTATILSKEERLIFAFVLSISGVFRQKDERERERGGNVCIRKVTGKMYREQLIFLSRVIIRMTKSKLINSNYSHTIVTNHEPL